MRKNDKNEEYLSIPEAAKMLGVSRIAVYKKVKNGQIKAIRVGRNYAIPRKDILGAENAQISEARKEEIDKAVHKTVKEYGEVLKLLGKG